MQLWSRLRLGAFLFRGGCVRNHRLGLDLYFHLCTLFEFYFVTVCVNEPVGNSDLAVKMVRALDPDLSLFWLA